MRVTRTWAAAGALVVAATSAVVAAVVPASSAAQTMSFSYKALSLPNDGFVDVNGDRQPSAGDYFLVADTYYNSAGKGVGYDRGTCTVIRVIGQDAELQCLVTAAIPGGQLTAQGIIHGSSSDFSIGITGGSGSYAGRQGEAHLASNAAGTAGTITFTLQ